MDVASDAVDDLDVPFPKALEAIDACRRRLPPGLSGVAGVYLEGAYGSVLHARDEFLHARGHDAGARWLARLGDEGWIRVGAVGSRLSSGEGSDQPTALSAPDLGADVVRSGRLAGLASTERFSALLAGALAEHRWLHLGTSTSWTASWPAADALVRALNSGRAFPRVGSVGMRGTIDRQIAEELAALGWRRISSPRLPFAA